MLAKAKTILHTARVPAGAIAMQCFPSVSGTDAVADVLKAVQEPDCDIIVVGREPFTGIKKCFTLPCGGLPGVQRFRPHLLGHGGDHVACER